MELNLALPAAEAASPTWLSVLLVVIPALAAVGAAVTAGLFARAARKSETSSQRLMNLEARLSDKKYEMYRPMIELYGNMLNKERAAKSAASIPQKTHDFATWITIYGSEEAVVAFHNLMQATYSAPPSEIFIRLYSEFVLACRRDLGQPDTTLTAGDMITMRLTDVYKTDGLLWALTDPWPEVCARVGWSPPWER